MIDCARASVFVALLSGPCYAQSAGGYRIGVTNDLGGSVRQYDAQGYRLRDNAAATRRDFNQIRTEDSRRSTETLSRIDQMKAENGRIQYESRVLQMVAQSGSLGDFQQALRAAGLRDRYGFSATLFDARGQKLPAAVSAANAALRQRYENLTSNILGTVEAASQDSQQYYDAMGQATRRATDRIRVGQQAVQQSREALERQRRAHEQEAASDAELIRAISGALQRRNNYQDHR